MSWPVQITHSTCRRQRLSIYIQVSVCVYVYLSLITLLIIIVIIVYMLRGVWRCSDLVSHFMTSAVRLLLCSLNLSFVSVLARSLARLLFKCILIFNTKCNVYSIFIRLPVTSYPAERTLLLLYQIYMNTSNNIALVTNNSLFCCIRWWHTHTRYSSCLTCNYNTYIIVQLWKIVCPSHTHARTCVLFFTINTIAF